MTESNQEETILGLKVETPEDKEAVVEAANDFISQYVGEDKKYKNTEELAKAYDHLNRFAETLKHENKEYSAQLQEQQTRSKTIDEVIDYIKTTTPTETTNETPPDFDKLISQKLQERDIQAREIEIQNKSKELLISTFGDEGKAAEAVNTYISNDPNKKNLVMILGKTDPEGLARLLNVSTENKEQSIVSPTMHSTKTTTSQGVGALPLTWTEATRVRKEDPKRYRSHAFQRSLHQAAAVAEKEGINFYKT